MKRAVQNLINDYYRRKRPILSLDSRVPEAAADVEVAEFEQQFIDSWRKDLLERAWASLEELEKSTGQPYHTVLRSRVNHPGLNSESLARHLSTAFNKPYSAGAMRQALQRSREKYVSYLLTEVRASLHNPSREELEQELIELNLLHYCRPFMKRQAEKR